MELISSEIIEILETTCYSGVSGACIKLQGPFCRLGPRQCTVVNARLEFSPARITDQLESSLTNPMHAPVCVHFTRGVAIDVVNNSKHLLKLTMGQALFYTLRHLHTLTNLLLIAPYEIGPLLSSFYS